jgi:hypothetical protein
MTASPEMAQAQIVRQTTAQLTCFSGPVPALVAPMQT